MGFPNETWYDHKGVIPNDHSVATGDPQMDDILRYTYFPPQEVTKLNGTYRIGIRLLGLYKDYSKHYKYITASIIKKDYENDKIML